MPSSQLHWAALLTNARSREMAEFTDDPMWLEMKAQDAAMLQATILEECSGSKRRWL